MYRRVVSVLLCPAIRAISSRLIPARLRMVQRWWRRVWGVRKGKPTFSRTRSTITFNISTDQVQDRRGDRNISHTSILGGLWTNGDDPSCPIDVIYPQRHEFLSPQGRIVAEQDHGLSSHIFMEKDVMDKPFPNHIVRHPGQVLLFAHWSSCWALSISSIVSSCNRVHWISPQVFTEKKIVKKTAGHHTQGNGIV